MTEESKKQDNERFGKSEFCSPMYDNTCLCGKEFNSDKEMFDHIDKWLELEKQLTEEVGQYNIWEA